MFFVYHMLIVFCSSCVMIKSILFMQNTNDTTILGRWRKVEDFFEVILGVHATCICKGHIGNKKTQEKTH